MKQLVALLGVLLMLTTAAASAAEHSQSLTFVAMGDMPYNNEEIKLLSAPGGKLAKAINELSPAFVIHYGDTKAGNVDCSDEVLTHRRDLLAQLYPNRLVYTPGDNEWTDCDKAYMSTRRDELERLSKLRALYFSGKGSDMTSGIAGISHQKALPENAMWQSSNVLFGTINISGTNNARNSIYRSDKKLAWDEADKRDTFDQQWLSELFKRAEKTKAAALVIAFQADIYKILTKGETPPCTATLRGGDCDGYRKLRDYMTYAAADADFPVLLIHGDTSDFCFHRPSPKIAPNLWRLNGPGDYKVIDVAKVSVDASNKAHPFTVTTLLSDKTPPASCD